MEKINKMDNIKIKNSVLQRTPSKKLKDISTKCEKIFANSIVVSVGKGTRVYRAQTPTQMHENRPWAWNTPLSRNEEPTQPLPGLSLCGGVSFCFGLSNCSLDSAQSMLSVWYLANPTVPLLC